MAKSSAPLAQKMPTKGPAVRKATTTIKRAGGSPNSGYEVLGRTFDGIDILKPKMKATHFKPSEVRRLFEQILGAEGIARIVRKSQAAGNS